MKKIISIILMVSLTIGLFSLCSVAVSDTQVYVTICNSKGKIVVTNELIDVSDTDKDGILTINDALVCAHNEFYEGGAKSGYKSGNTSYGLSLVKLWGVANGGSYGYCINDTAASSLLDKVKKGDHVYAYIYTDTVNFSDAYAYFDIKEINCHSYSIINLTLYKLTFDSNFKPVKSPVKNATITIDGEASKYKTDENGKVSIGIIKSGNYVLSATVSDKTVITPPVCTLNIEKGSLVDFFSYLLTIVLSIFSKNK